MKQELFDMLMSQAVAERSKAILTLNLLSEHPAGIGDHSTGDFYNNAEEALSALVDGSSMVVLYPNPTSTGTVMIQWNQPLESDLKVKLYNAMGQLVLKQNFFEEGAISCPIGVSQFASGMYMMEVELNGKTETHRLMMNR